LTDTVIGRSGCAPLPGAARRFDHNRPPDAHEERAVVRIDEEFVRGEQPVVRVVPPEERLDVHGRPRFELHDRLVEPDQLTAIERALQVRFGGDVLAPVHRRSSDRDAPSPVSEDRRDRDLA